MKINVVMPQLGESVSEGEVVRWLKRAGDAVRRDEALVEVKTDKATVEIPAPSSGTLSEILVPEGETVQVGASIAVIESTSEAAALAVEGAPSAPRQDRAARHASPKGSRRKPCGQARHNPPRASPPHLLRKSRPTPPAGKPATPAGDKARRRRRQASPPHRRRRKPAERRRPSRRRVRRRRFARR